MYDDLVKSVNDVRESYSTVSMYHISMAALDAAKDNGTLPFAECVAAKMWLSNIWEKYGIVEMSCEKRSLKNGR